LSRAFFVSVPGAAIKGAAKAAPFIAALEIED
jgi:hypothetical protein